MIDILAILLLLAGLSNLVLAWFVWRREPEQPLNRLFGLMVLLVALWVLATFGERALGLRFFSRSAYGLAALVPPAFFVFSWTFARQARPPAGTTVWAALLGTVFALLSYTPLVIDSFAGPAKLGMVGRLGPFFIPYAGYILAYVGSAFWQLFGCYRRASSGRRLQLQYMFIGLAVFSLLAIILNLVLPLLGDFRFSQVGPATSLFFIAFTTYAIVAHQLLNIELVLSRSAIYLFLGGLLFSLNFLFLYFFQVLTDVRVPTSLFIAYSAFLIGLTFVFTSFRRSFADLVDRVVYHDFYDYASLVREIAERLVTKLELNGLIDYLTQAIGRSLGLSLIEVWLLDEARENLYLWAPEAAGPGTGILTISPLGRSLAAVKKVWFWRRSLDFISDWLTDVRLRRFFTQRQAEVFLPLVFRDEFIGFILLGAKPAGDYSGRDRDLLATLARQASVAVGNARLVRQQQRNIEEIARMETQARLTAELEDKNRKLQQAYEQLTVAQAKLIRAEKLAAISDITLTLQHEVNNPLTAILLENWSGLERLRQGRELAAGDFSRILASIRDNASRIKAVMTKLRQIEDPASPGGPAAV